MENAAKALLIAGFMLIALITISMIIIIFRNVMQITETYNTRLDNQEIVEFNSQFIIYTTSNEASSYITGEDVTTIINKVKNWNSSTEDDSEKITITGISVTNFDEHEFIQSSTIENDYKYKCNVTEYDTETGRIKTIEITQT